jgi:hypothetical protein
MFKRKKLGWLSSSLLLIALLYASLCGAKEKVNTPSPRTYEAIVESKCKSMIDGFKVELKAKTTEIVNAWKGRNPEMVSLDYEVVKIRCISEVQTVVRLKTKAKLKGTFVDSKTKKKTVEILCAGTDEIIVLEKKGALIIPMATDKKVEPFKVPCE